MMMTPVQMALVPFWQTPSGTLNPAFGIPVAFACLVILVVIILKLRELPSSRRAKRAPTMTPHQVEALMIGTPPRIIDLRPLEEFNGAKGHIRGALSMPLPDLRKRLGELNARDRDAILLVDETDELSHLALPLLTSAGHPWVYVLKGGMRAWRRAKLPLYKPH
nr:rhodanese-like domain-containing protein [uncultured Holophaga sp.]